MPVNLSFTDLMEYSEWERQKRFAWLGEQGAEVLKINAGPHGDGRFETVGDLIRHIFSAEARYVDRLSGRPLTDSSSIPNDDLEQLARFGRRSRTALREFVDTFPAEKWDSPEKLNMMNTSFQATPRKIIAHVLLHEIRHWAQIATVLRLNGMTGGFHDFLFSPALGGELQLGQNA